MFSKEPYDKPELKLTTPTNKLEVLCELMVDFENLKDNGFDFLDDVKIQGWEKYFDRLQGPVLFHLVREFWSHVKTSVFQVTSFFMGNKIVITKKLIAKLIGHDGFGIRCNQMVERKYDLIEISKVIFTSGVHSNKIKDILPHIRIWAKILLGCVHHRRSTNSSDYINGDQQYILYYIATKKKVNLSALLFQYLRDMVKETRDGSKNMRNWIPLGRLISNILMESKLIDSLTEAQMTKELKS